MKHLRKRSEMWLALLVVVLSMVVMPAHALSIAKATLEELTRESQHIVVGRIVAIDYQWQNVDHQVIETVLTVAVENPVKGVSSPTIQVTQLGGTIGDLTMEIPGTPQFDVGDEVLLFLQDHQNKYWIHSIALGAFSIVTENNGEKLVVNHLQGIDLIDPGSGARVAADEAFPIIPLTEFLEQVNHYIR